MIQVGTQNEAARHKWVRSALKSIPQDWRLLDAGAGEQQYRGFCSHLRYVCQDFAEYRPEAEKAGLRMKSWDYGQLDIVSDITDIPEPDASFDAILCTEVLEHIPEPTLAIKEFSRLLRVGGVLILTAPFCSLTHLAPYHYSSGFNRYFYKEHLPAHGFEITEISPNGHYFDYLAQELHRLPSMMISYTTLRLHNWIARLVAGVVLTLLQQCADRDAGSSEVLTFGYHVRATRTGPTARRLTRPGTLRTTITRDRTSCFTMVT